MFMTMSPLTFSLTYGLLTLLSLGSHVSCEHFIDFSGGSGAGVSPYLVYPQQSAQPYLIPFKAIDSVKYLSALNRHKRSTLYDLPRVEMRDPVVESVPVSQRGYLVHRDLPLIYM